MWTSCWTRTRTPRNPVCAGGVRFAGSGGEVDDDALDGAIDALIVLVCTGFDLATDPFHEFIPHGGIGPSGGEFTGASGELDCVRLGHALGERGDLVPIGLGPSSVAKSAVIPGDW